MRKEDVRYAFAMAFRRNPALWILIGINTGVGLLCLLIWGIMLISGSSASPESWLSLPGGIIGWMRKPWTLLTYMVTHYSFMHYLFNMLWLYWFGEVIAWRVSTRRFIAFYAAGGIAGGICFLAATTMIPALSSGIYSLSGASASVVCVMVLAALLEPDRRFSLFLIGSVRLKWIAIVCLALLFLGLGGGNAGGEAAHFGGAVAGLCIFAFMKRGRTPATQPVKEPRRKATKVAKALSERRSDMERLDELLDKIKRSGYDSLSSSEQSELNALAERGSRNRNGKTN